MEEQTFEGVRTQWATQVGWFSIYMGEIESAVSLLLSLAERGTSGSLDERLDRLLASAQKLKTEFKHELRNGIADAHVLRDLRNSVLHSAIHVTAGFEGIPDDVTMNAADVIDVPIVIRSKVHDRKGKHTNIGLDEMLELVGRANSLSKLLWAIAVDEQLINNRLL